MNSIPNGIIRTAGVYYDPGHQRTTRTTSIGGMSLQLTQSQESTLFSLMDFVRLAPASSVVPAYISAETGSGKTEVALRLALLLLKTFSSQLRQLHAVYLAPTRKLAREVTDRLNDMVTEEKVDVRMISISGQDEDKADRVKQALSVFQNDNRILLATNIQFLSSLATKASAFYHLRPRTGQFQIAAAISEANVIIVDEPHFYRGKAFVRVLTLLLAILEHKRSSGSLNPTLLLFISATMNVPEIENLLRYLVADCGLQLTPLVEEGLWPLQRRWLDIVEADRGEKWSVFERSPDVSALFARIAGIVCDSERFTAVYWDNIAMLAKLEEYLQARGLEVVVWHSQMPATLQDTNLKRLGNGRTRVAIVTSAAEIGVEFERWGVAGVDRMVSVNTPTVAKAIQRWGRLARRNDSAGVVHFIDQEPRALALTNQMANGFSSFDPTRKDYPSLLAKSQDLNYTYSSAYRSPVADRAFALAVKGAIAHVTGEVLLIYLSPSVQVRNAANAEQLTVPLRKLSAGAMVVQADAWLEFSKVDGDFCFSLRTGRLPWHPSPLLPGSVRVSSVRSTLRSRVLPEWTKILSITRAELGEGEVSVALPNVDAGFRFSSDLLALYFPVGSLDVGPSFATSEGCELLLETFGLASEDMDAIAIRKLDQNADIVFLYEPARRAQALSVGAVEYGWRDILLGDYR